MRRSLGEVALWHSGWSSFMTHEAKVKHVGAAPPRDLGMPKRCLVPIGGPRIVTGRVRCKWCHNYRLQRIISPIEWHVRHDQVTVWCSGKQWIVGKRICHNRLWIEVPVGSTKHGTKYSTKISNRIVDGQPSKGERETVPIEGFDIF